VLGRNYEARQYETGPLVATETSLIPRTFLAGGVPYFAKPS